METSILEHSTVSALSRWEEEENKSKGHVMWRVLEVAESIGGIAQTEHQWVHVLYDYTASLDCDEILTASGFDNVPHQNKNIPREAPTQ